MSKRQKRILLALGWYHYRVHRGIEKFAVEHGWQLHANLAREKVIPWGWEGDGILAWLGAGNDLAEFVLRANKPTVDFSFRRSHLHFPRVLLDHADAARLAAEHFISQGLVNFMFYSDTENWTYEERGTGFVQAVEHAGFHCFWLRWHQSEAFTTDREQWKQKRHWLTQQLKHAPKPVGIFGANDDHALELLECCENAGLAVPEEVSIIGADNSLLALDAMRTPISSVDTNLQMVGYRGAELLGQLMHGKPAPAEPIRVAAAGLIVRKSSDLLAMPHAGVARCLRFIREHYHEAISVKDLVSLAGMSRRGLYTAFLQHIGRSPGEELQRVRIECAKKLLAKGDYKMDLLAEMCGYQSVTGFGSAFKQATGLSPRQFRKQVAG